MTQNPNQTNAPTKMVADQKKKVRIRAMQMINLGSPVNPNGIQLAAGAEAEVDEDIAEQLCQPIEGMYNFSGELDSRQAGRHKHIRAVKV